MSFPPKRPALLPVIHLITQAQAERSVRAAVAAGVSGIWLINHHSNHHVLVGAYHEIRRRHPDLWIGLNLLDLNSYEAVRKAPDGVDAVWVDNAMILEHEAEQPLTAELMGEVERRRPLTLFGGVAFKYQTQVSDVELVAKLAAPYLDVVTTSGPATGRAADPDKLRQMRAGLGAEGHLALASGVTVRNVQSYLPYVDYFLVASSVTDNRELLLPGPLRRLRVAIEGE